MDCNKTIDFLLERKRLCDSQHDGGNPCDECPLENICDEQSNAEIIKSAISRLQKWSDKHPKKTYAQDFLEKFPNARIGDDGLPEVCRMANLWRNKQVRPPRRGKGEASVRALHGLVCCLIKPTTEEKEKDARKNQRDKILLQGLFRDIFIPRDGTAACQGKGQGKEIQRIERDAETFERKVCGA